MYVTKKTGRGEECVGINREVAVGGSGAMARACPTENSEAEVAFLEGDRQGEQDRKQLMLPHAQPPPSLPPASRDFYSLRQVLRVLADLQDLGLERAGKQSIWRRSKEMCSRIDAQWVGGAVQA